MHVPHLLRLSSNQDLLFCQTDLNFRAKLNKESKTSVSLGFVHGLEDLTLLKLDHKCEHKVKRL
jgi:hypothetical protein